MSAAHRVAITAVCFLLLLAAHIGADDFWTARSYSQWSQDECMQLVSRATVREFPWKRDLGRSGPFSKGVVVWYSETVWWALFRTQGLSEDAAASQAAGCRPGLVLAIYLKDDPGFDTVAYRPSFSPGSLLGSTFLDNGRGGRLQPAPQQPSCKPFVDKYTIAFNFPVSPGLVQFLKSSDYVTFVCGGLGIQQTFDLSEMQVHGARDACWGCAESFAPPPPPPRRPTEVHPLPFKVFPE